MKRPPSAVVAMLLGTAAFAQEKTMTTFNFDSEFSLWQASYWLFCSARPCFPHFL